MQWQVIEPTEDTEHISAGIFNEDAHRLIATVWRSSAPSDGEAMANARLIAAAPELLEAARNYAHDACYECFKGECDKPFHNALLRAIAKAEGK
jgi:hypothetical protein